MTEASLDADLAVTVDDRVEFVVRITNTGDTPIELEFRDGLAVDVTVERDDEAVWRWSEGRMVTQALWSERLGPGEATTYEARWDDPTPGRYEAVASLAATNTDVEARAPFEV